MELDLEMIFYWMEDSKIKAYYFVFSFQLLPTYFLLSTWPRTDLGIFFQFYSFGPANSS